MRSTLSAEETSASSTCATSWGSSSGRRTTPADSASNRCKIHASRRRRNRSSAGVYLWQFCDIRVSDEWWGVRPRTMNNKGVFDEYRRLKLCAEVVKKIFRET